MIRSPLTDFSDVKQEMEVFSNAFQQFILDRKNTILISRQQHKLKERELESRIRKVSEDIDQAAVKGEKTKNLIAISLQDLKSKQSKVDVLASQVQSRTEMKRSLNTDIEYLRKEVGELESGVRDTKLTLSEQVSRDNEELTKFEMHLGMKIESIEIDILRFKFVNISPTDIDREVWCELLLNEENYRIGLTYPSLPQQTVLKIELDLNTHGKIIVFLKEMRSVLRDTNLGKESFGIITK